LSPSRLDKEAAKVAIPGERGIEVVRTGQSDSLSKAVEGAMESMNPPFLGVDYNGTEGVLVQVRGGTGTSFGLLVKASESVAEMACEKDAHACESKVEPDIEKALRVTTMLKDIQSRFLGDLYDAKIKLFNMEPFAGPETPLDLGTELYQMEPSCL
jgi:cell division GTPase FtsZ